MIENVIFHVSSGNILCKGLPGSTIVILYIEVFTCLNAVCYKPESNFYMGIARCVDINSIGMIDRRGSSAVVLQVNSMCA